MGYLIPSDYKKTIQASNLAQVIRNDLTTLADSEQTAIGEAISYLVQKYDLEAELQNTPAWEKAEAYKATNRVYLDAPIYNTGSTYNTGDYVTFVTGSGMSAFTNVYKALVDSITGGWDAAKWKLICPQFQMFNAALPKPLFNLRGYYRVGDQVFWKDMTYTCLTQTRTPSDETMLQYTNIQNIPYSNVFPDNPSDGFVYWGSATLYEISANTDILNTTYWQVGDSRCKQLVTYLVDIALYHAHAAITPNNVPEVRIKRYDDAIRWLNKAAKGDVTAALPLLQPRQGSRNRYGGQIKNNNSW